MVNLPTLKTMPNYASAREMGAGSTTISWRRRTDSTSTMSSGRTESKRLGGNRQEWCSTLLILISRNRNLVAVMTSRSTTTAATT
eukprot:6607032-Heterocapsa_arctica.AAC.1